MISNTIFIILVFIGVYILFGSYLYLNQDNLIFQPRPVILDSCTWMNQSNIYNIDNKTIYYHHIITDPKGTVVIYHGNADSICNKQNLVSFFTRNGYDVILVSYYGYVNGQGRPTFNKIMANVQDMIEVTNNLNSEIILYGESIGTYFAMYHSNQINAKKTILISPFKSLKPVVRNTLPIYPSSLLRNSFNTLKIITENNFENPILILHGENDRVIPQKLSKSFETFSFVTRFTLENVGHNDIYSNENFFKIIEDFIS